MKIKAIICVDGHEREFEISCGLGDKSFKWLAMVASQRLALSTPNGALRCRDIFRGLGDRTQHLPFEISLENGDVPHPSTTLSDLIRDGEKVYIHLISNQKISSSSGTPNQTNWSTVAFSHSTSQFKNDQEGQNDEEDQESEDSSETPAKIKANSDFMRLILESQMINWKSITHQVTTLWNSTIRHAMPGIAEEDSKSIQYCFKKNWDTTHEMYNQFTQGTSGNMYIDEFTNFLSESGVFPARDLLVLGPRVHRRACWGLARARNAIDPDGTHSVRSLDFAGFLVSLVLCAQLRHHDTFEKDVQVEDCHDALQELYSRSIVPLAERCEYLSILKDTFCSDRMLNRMRALHESLFLVFQKYTLRSGETATTCRLDHFVDCLSDCLLVDPSKSTENLNFARSLFRKVQLGSIFGRDPLLSSSSSTESKSSNRYEMNNVPSEHFEYPEFVEAIARAGVQRSKYPPNSIVIPPPNSNALSGFSNLGGGGGGGGGGGAGGKGGVGLNRVQYDEDLSHMNMEESMMMGFRRAIETLKKK